MRSFFRDSKLTAAFFLSVSVAGCAPVGDDTFEGEEAELEVGTSQQALTVLTPTAFTMSRAYHGTSSSLFGTSSCSSNSLQSLTGHEPAEAGRYPVAIWLTGTTGDYAGPGAKDFTANMAKLGYVAVSVEYSNGTYPSCSALKTKASCVFNGGSANSAISKVCARAKADCSKGVVVAGISQGANLASLAKNYDSRARAAYLISNVVTPSFFDNTSCLKDSATSFAPSQIRAASGEKDEFMSGISEVRSNLVSSTGHSCTGNNCMKADGSGWYIVTNAEVADGAADHCFILSGGCKSTTSDPTYATGPAPWTGWSSLQWLASKATR